MVSVMKISKTVNNVIMVWTEDEAVSLLHVEKGDWHKQHSVILTVVLLLTQKNFDCSRL